MGKSNYITNFVYHASFYLNNCIISAWIIAILWFGRQIKPNSWFMIFDEAYGVKKSTNDTTSNVYCLCRVTNQHIGHQWCTYYGSVGLKVGATKSIELIYHSYLKLFQFEINNVVLAKSWKEIINLTYFHQTISYSRSIIM